MRFLLLATILIAPCANAFQDPGSLNDLGNPDRPDVGALPTEPISIDFEEAELGDVIKQIGIQTGRNISYDPNIAIQKVTIIGHHQVPPDMALDILESILQVRGLAMTESLDGNLLQIRQIQQGVPAEKLDIEINRRPPVEGYDRYSVHVLRVRYANAQDVMEMLQNMGFETMTIVSYEPTNTLIVSGTADAIRRVYMLLEAVDMPGSEPSLEIFLLEYERAEKLQEMVEQVLLDADGDGGAGAQATPRPTIQVRQRAAQGAQSAATAVGESREVLRLFANERLNALIVVATAGLMQEVRFLIDQLDTPTPYEQEDIHYVALLNQKAEEMAEVLGRMFSGVTPRQEGQTTAAATAELQPFEKEVTVDFFEATNGLIILASAQDFKKLKLLIDQMDVPARSVSVESAILEVTISDGYQLTVSSAVLDEENFFGLSNAAAIANLIAGGPLSLAGPGGTAGIIDGTTEIPTVDGGTIEVPNVPLLMQAIETLTDVEVVSRPNLMVKDNESASLSIGQEIPLISTLGDVNDQTGFQSRSRVDRRDTGVLLDVEPQINEGDYVSLGVHVEVSSPVVSGVGIDPNEVGATIDKAVVENNVVIRDGQTAILGGLIRDTRNRTVAQVPVLGDIPLLGWLFRSKRNDRNKRNVIILLTPHIIRESQDQERVTAYHLNEFYQAAFDELFGDDGFVRKVRRKHREREREHPVADYRDRYGTKFRRGDIR